MPGDYEANWSTILQRIHEPTETLSACLAYFLIVISLTSSQAQQGLWGPSNIPGSAQLSTQYQWKQHILNIAPNVTSVITPSHLQVNFWHSEHTRAQASLHSMRQPPYSCPQDHCAFVTAFPPIWNTLPPYPLSKHHLPPKPNHISSTTPIWNNLSLSTDAHDNLPSISGKVGEAQKHSL